MRRSHIAIVAAGLIGAGLSLWGLLWGRWSAGASKGRTALASQLAKAAATPPVILRPTSRNQTPAGSFAFQHEGTPVTLDLERVRRSHENLVREAPSNPANTSPPAPDPDLSFLSWTGRSLRGVERIRTRKCWVIDFTNPDAPQGTGPHCLVRLFVDQELGLLMRTQYYDWLEKRALEYSVLSGRRVNGVLVVKAAEARHYEPGGRRVAQEVAYRLP